MEEKQKGYDYSDLRLILIAIVIVIVFIALPSKTEGGFVGNITAVKEEKVFATIRKSGEVVEIKTSKDDNFSITQEVIIYSEDHILFKRYLIK